MIAPSLSLIVSWDAHLQSKTFVFFIIGGRGVLYAVFIGNTLKLTEIVDYKAYYLFNFPIIED